MKCVSPQARLTSNAPVSSPPSNHRSAPRWTPGRAARRSRRRVGTTRVTSNLDDSKSCSGAPPRRVASTRERANETKRTRSRLGDPPPPPPRRRRPVRCLRPAPSSPVHAQGLTRTTARARPRARSRPQDPPRRRRARWSPRHSRAAPRARAGSRSCARDVDAADAASAPADPKTPAAATVARVTHRRARACARARARAAPSPRAPSASSTKTLPEPEPVRARGVGQPTTTRFPRRRTRPRVALGERVAARAPRARAAPSGGLARLLASGDSVDDEKMRSRRE